MQTSPVDSTWVALSEPLLWRHTDRHGNVADLVAVGNGGARLSILPKSPGSNPEFVLDAHETFQLLHALLKMVQS